MKTGRRGVAQEKEGNARRPPGEGAAQGKPGGVHGSGLSEGRQVVPSGSSMGGRQGPGNLDLSSGHREPVKGFKEHS